MCGRYATTRTPDALSDEFGAQIADSFVELEPDWNVAPTKSAPIIIERPAAEDRPGGREVLTAQWGLVPSWAKDPKIGSRMINARSETVAEKPSFAKAFAKRRAIVPADGFYEWYPGEKKQPFFICPRNRSTLAMAGLYEFWKSGPDAGVGVPPAATLASRSGVGVPPAATLASRSGVGVPPAATLASRSGGWLITFTILTTSAADDLGHLHDRAPMMLVGDEIDAWLDPAPTSVVERLGMLVPAVPGRLDAWPVSTAVNNHRNNGPGLIQPIPAE